GAPPGPASGWQPDWTWLGPRDEGLPNDIPAYDICQWTQISPGPGRNLDQLRGRGSAFGRDRTGRRRAVAMASEPVGAAMGDFGRLFCEGSVTAVPDAQLLSGSGGGATAWHSSSRCGMGLIAPARSRPGITSRAGRVARRM